MPKVSEITGVHKKVGQEPQIVTVENDFRFIQPLVGGHITQFRLGDRGGIVLLCDEEAELKPSSRPNIHLNSVAFSRGIVLGDVFFCGQNRTGSQWRSLTEAEILFVQALLAAQAVPS